MTDGERLVWASVYAIFVSRGNDAAFAVQEAALAVAELRAAAGRRNADGSYAVSQSDARELLDEMVMIP